MKSESHQDGKPAAGSSPKSGRSGCGCAIVALLGLLLLFCLFLAGTPATMKTVERTKNQGKLARLAMRSEDVDVRNAAVGKLQNQAILAKIAMEDDNIGIRYAAIANLKDQALLARVARTVYVRKDVFKNGIRYVETENEVFFRKAAVLNLNDPALLAQIAVEGGDRDVDGRMAAVEKLEDQALLAGIAVEAEYADVRKSAIDKLIDQKLLTRIALEDRNCACHRAAVRRLNDQALLARIALEYQNDSCCLAAVERLSAPALLAKVAIEAGAHRSESDVCVPGFRFGSDHEIELEHERKRGSVRAAAVNKLADSSLLAKVWAEAECREARADAYRKLNELIPDVGSLRASTEDAHVRLYATLVGKIRESSIPEAHRERWFLNFSEIVPMMFVPSVAEHLGTVKDFQINWFPRSAEYTHGMIRGEEVKLSISFTEEGRALQHYWATSFPPFVHYTKGDAPKWLSAWVDASAFYAENLLHLPKSAHARIAQESKCREVREAAAAAAMSDQSLLATTALEARSTGVREIAVRKLEDQAALARVAVGMRYLDWSLRKVVVNKLEDQAALAKVAVQDESDDIRHSAVMKLKDEGLLARIAEEDKELAVRHAAKNRVGELRTASQPGHEVFP